MLNFRDKKRSPNNGTAPERKKKPDQFEGGGEKKGWPGDMKVLEKKDPSNLKAIGRKKCPREVFSLLLGHSIFVK